MDDALAVQDHVEAVVGHVEQPVRLDNLQAFVEQRGGIDGDAAAHGPRRVSQRFLRRHVA
jgi:hypothetical protein